MDIQELINSSYEGNKKESLKRLDKKLNNTNPVNALKHLIKKLNKSDSDIENLILIYGVKALGMPPTASLKEVADKIQEGDEGFKDWISSLFKTAPFLKSETFNRFPNGEIFASGDTPNSPEGIFMTRDNLGALLTWVAVKGYANDWCIYLHWKGSSLEYIKQSGDKVSNKENILKLVPCDNELLNNYRL